MAQGVELKAKEAFSGWPMFFGWLAMIIFACHASTHMVGAGDTWVAMACGRHFVNHGVDTVEPFSANSHKPGPTPEEIAKWPAAGRWLADKVGFETVKKWHPTGWVNQNWLTHVIFYKLTTFFGSEEEPHYNALVYWKFAVYILTVICVYYSGRLLGANCALAAAFACFAMFTGRSFFDIRPAGFSNLLVAIYILILILTTYKNVLFIWLLVPLIAFWCNVHGGYIYAFIMLAPFVGLNLVGALLPRWFVSIGKRGIYHTIGAGAVSLIASVIFNPFHLTNFTHTFVISLSKHAERWRTVNEWHPAFSWGNPVGTAFPFLVMVVMLIGLVILWPLSRRMKPRLVSAPRNELEIQRKIYNLIAKTFGFFLTVGMTFVVFISFSWLNLDVGSFLICAGFTVILLLSVYKNVHFIYLQIPLILGGMYFADEKAGYYGRYIYPFVLVVGYVLLNTVAGMLSEKVKFEKKNIAFVCGTALVSLVLMLVIFDPFKFEGGWQVDKFFALRRPWHPVYERNLTLSYANLFNILYVVNIVSIAFYLSADFLRDIFAKDTEEAEVEDAGGKPFNLRKIDLALLAIAVLTVYMALKSRRFIPIAAIAACPVMAWLIDQVIRTVAVSRNFHRFGVLCEGKVCKAVRIAVISAGIAVVVGLGGWWSYKFKMVYLDPWPTDTDFTSVFMRMTASDAKPFYACRFIRDNKMSGNMFNYWTEGGFIAWGQEPDPETGKTPLQLFMDGRAQAAYERKDYDVWTYIMSGGKVAARIVGSANARKRQITAAEYRQIGDWICGELRKHDVWVVMMPSATYNDPKKSSYHFVKGIEYAPSWPIAFMNEKQKIFIDVETPQGKELFEKVVYGKAVFPDAASKNLIRARNLFLYGNGEAEKLRGLESAIKACQERASQTVMREIRIAAANYPFLRQRVYEFCKGYFEEFDKRKDEFARQDGYFHRMIVAMNACSYLGDVARGQRDTKLADFYRGKIREYNNERLGLLEYKRW